MSRKPKFTFEEKLEIVNEYLNNGVGSNTLAQKIGVNRSNVKIWIAKYKAYGIDGLKYDPKHTRYSREFKLNVVKEYISGSMSYVNLCIKYKIKSTKQLRDWISLYNKNKVLKSGGYDSMRIKGIRKKSYSRRSCRSS